MTASTAIHFGYFVRDAYTRLGMRQVEFAQKAELSSRRLTQIERMEKPRVYGATKARIATALGIKPEDFDRVWQSTPVPVPEFQIDRRGENQPRRMVLRFPPEVYAAAELVAEEEQTTPEEWAVRVLTSVLERRANADLVSAPSGGGKGAKVAK